MGENSTKGRGEGGMEDLFGCSSVERGKGGGEVGLGIRGLPDWFQKLERVFG